jgi:hypothetical protein
MAIIIMDGLIPGALCAIGGCNFKKEIWLDKQINSEIKKLVL